MLAWMGYATLLAMLVGAAALTAEQAARLLKRPTRWAWAAALGVSLLAPLLLPTTNEPRDSFDAITPAVMSRVEAVRVAPAELEPTAAVVAPARPGRERFARLEAALPWLWLASSFCVAILLLVAGLRLAAARRSWRRGRLLRTPVWLSRDSGPAVVGVVRPEIVVPEAVLERDRESQRLVLAHEREHVAARDPLLLACGWLGALAMPWNPAVWWQLRRLRLAVETDCDARVLAPGRDVARYGALLLEVGRGASLGMPAAAFAEPKSMLRRRIEAMTEPTRNHPRRRAAALAGVCVLVLIAAAAVPPRRAPMPVLSSRSAVPAAGTASHKIAADTPIDVRSVDVRPTVVNGPQLQRSIARAYPPLLRDAGVSGDALLRLVVNREGFVRPGSIAVVSATHDAFAEIAVRVMDSAKFTPAKKGGVTVPVVLSFPVQFRTGSGFGMGGIAPGDTTPEARLEALRRENARLRRELERLRREQAAGETGENVSILRQLPGRMIQRERAEMQAAREEMERRSGEMQAASEAMGQRSGEMFQRMERVRGLIAEALPRLHPRVVREGLPDDRYVWFLVDPADQLERTGILPVELDSGLRWGTTSVERQIRIALPGIEIANVHISTGVDVGTAGEVNVAWITASSDEVGRGGNPETDQYVKR